MMKIAPPVCPHSPRPTRRQLPRFATLAAPTLATPSLGAALLAAGRTEEAAETFDAALVESPNNGWVLFGLKQAQEQLGDAEGAKATAELLSEAWLGPDDFLELSKL